MGRNIQVIDYTLSKTDSRNINTNIPFPTSFKEAKTIQQSNAVIAAYVNANSRELEDHQSEIDEHTETLEQIADDLVDMTEDIEDLTTNVNDLNTNKQDNLISGTNIKTINNTSLLGSGNINIQSSNMFKGEWNENTIYKKGEIVTYDTGSMSLVCISLMNNNTGNEPDLEDVYGSTVWQIVNVAYYTNTTPCKTGIGYISSYAGNPHDDLNTYFGYNYNGNNMPTLNYSTGEVNVKSLKINNVVTNVYSTEEKTKLTNIFDLIYPVGSIYMSVNEVSPATLFGGTWEQIKDTFLLSAGDTYTAGSTGGESEHKLTTNEIPSHNHKVATTTDRSGQTYFSYALGFSNWGEKYNATVLTSGTTSTGGEQAHNNMPPYLTVYMWKRTA